MFLLFLFSPWVYVVMVVVQTFFSCYIVHFVMVIYKIYIYIIAHYWYSKSVNEWGYFKVEVYITTSMTIVILLKKCRVLNWKDQKEREKPHLGRKWLNRVFVKFNKLKFLIYLYPKASCCLLLFCLKSNQHIATSQPFLPNTCFFWRKERRQTNKSLTTVPARSDQKERKKEKKKGKK